MREAGQQAPPRAALSWVAGVAGGPVREVQPLPGGIASSVHAIAVELPGGARRELVLRRFTRRDWHEPDLARREARALRAVADVPIPTPALLAVDETGAETDVPAVLMSRLPGRPQLAPSSLAPWLRSLAALLPPLHESSSARAGLARDYAPYAAAGFAVPGWALHRECWERALRVLGGGVPDAPRVAIHRDFHPANVLFERSAVTGLVDWTNACRGPQAIDVAHCRLNLAALLGPDAAEGFLLAWQAESGAVHDRRWDLVGCLDAVWTGYPGWEALGARPPSIAVQRERVEEHLRRVLEHC
jgi:aminoglycoside phosphotransferase (APT) family kinase protein